MIIEEIINIIAILALSLLTNLWAGRGIRLVDESGIRNIELITIEKIKLEE
ncbi:MAG: hypothetical protein QXO21_01240 [Candidatus Anstonellales archaeon]